VSRTDWTGAHRRGTGRRSVAREDEVRASRRCFRAGASAAAGQKCEDELAPLLAKEDLRGVVSTGRARAAATAVGGGCPAVGTQGGD
jgi:hypothetical protein